IQARSVSLTKGCWQNPLLQTDKDGTVCCVYFFFSSRRRHTRCLSDWSSDVCSSDLGAPSVDQQRYELMSSGEGVDPATGLIQAKIGRASCRERGYLSVVGQPLQK